VFNSIVAGSAVGGAGGVPNQVSSRKSVSAAPTIWSREELGPYVFVWNSIEYVRGDEVVRMDAAGPVGPRAPVPPFVPFNPGSPRGPRGMLRLR